MLGVVPFGLIAGLAVVENGLGLPESLGFSLVVFAGASQLAALELLGGGAPVAVVLVTALAINVRFVMYSASMAPQLADQPTRRRLLGAYLLTDHAFAVVSTPGPADDPADRWDFYLGAALVMWGTWQVATVAGALLGDALPDALPLAFAAPLAFLSLLVPAVTDRPTLAAAISAAGVAVVAAPLPANLGMPLAAMTGVLVGWGVARRRR